ncbi:MAG: hypothetical protein KJ558_06080 [Gammaproteobacteria bacterium]|nr:hypothetical protein [Gammaproteobacteria bacterium]MBU1654386.1 hypothetical protein [Gammaproteobacteria bacterium]MBU1960227.1 hypothetical protein [Gammaproteobacteria bacterium]
MPRPAHALLTLWILFSLAVAPLGQAWSASLASAGCGAHKEMAKDMLMAMSMDKHCGDCPSDEGCSGGGCLACHSVSAFFPLSPNTAGVHADLCAEAIPVSANPAYTSLEPIPLYRPPRA